MSYDSDSSVDISDVDLSSVDISDVDLSDDESATSTIPREDVALIVAVASADTVRGSSSLTSGADAERSLTVKTKKPKKPKTKKPKKPKKPKTKNDDDGDDTALLQLKEGKFFGRLGHFMSVQRKFEEGMQKIDATGRMKEIEVVSHSGGILEEDGSYKVKYQQRNADGDPAQNLGEVYVAAYQIKQSLRDLLDSMVDKVKGLDYIDAKIIELKPRDAANDKAREEYLTRTPGPPETWIYDILRASVTCKTVKQMKSVNKFLTKKAHIVQAKNRFVVPTFSGYRDILYHVLLDWHHKESVQFVAEIQVHHKDVLNLEKMFSLENHYKYFRPIFAGPSRSVIQTLRDLERIQKAGKIDNSLIQKVLSFDDPDQLFVHGKLFNLKLENFDFALQIYSRVLELQVSSIGEVHPKTAATYQDIGIVQANLGDFDQALRSLHKCLEIQEEIFGSFSPEVAITRIHMGRTLIERGDDGDELWEHRGALQQYRKALVIREKCLGEDHLDVAASYQDIGQSLSKLGDFQGALAAYRECLTILESSLGENHADVAVAHSLLGNVLHEQGDFQGAMEEYSFALAIREEVHGKSHVSTAESHTQIGQLFTDVQDYDEAETRHRKALRIRDTILGKESPESAESHYWIGYVLNQKGDYEAALREHNMAHTIRSAILPKKHPDTRASIRSIVANENNQQEP